MRLFSILLASLIGSMSAMAFRESAAQEFQFELRQQSIPAGGTKFQRTTTPAKWTPSQTAVIICDVWDAHHCLNAVRRLDEMLPRMNEVVQEARKRGAIIIHAPSDCMNAYTNHPARQRAIEAPKADNQPKDVVNWCSKIPSEEAGIYPIDQSDGGEDDDPKEHDAWAEELTKQGRNPKMPWKSQHSKIVIDETRDFISDRGDEVWNILEASKVQNVILLGVHTNMCVLGRPFGLRQMVRNGKNTVLVRDMTDCMYNPKRSPFVDHFTGNDLIVSHIERYVCPTITSDQIIGGKPFRFSKDERSKVDVMDVSYNRTPAEPIRSTTWQPIQLPVDSITKSTVARKIWYRCGLLLSSQAIEGSSKKAVRFGLPATGPKVTAWLDGQSIAFGQPIDSSLLQSSDLKWLVLCVEDLDQQTYQLPVPTIAIGSHDPVKLAGTWEYCWDDSISHDQPSLPAKFGASPSIVVSID